jgi:hypothetical protein
MKNTLNSGTIDALTPGSTLLISARQVSNGEKVQLEFAEKIQQEDRPVSALALLNASDSRFSSGARRGWLTVQPEDATKHLGIDFSDANDAWYDTEKGMMMDLNILNPSAILNGIQYFFRLYIFETTEGTDWENANLERSAKRAGKDGDYITHEGNYIFSRGKVDLFTKEQTPTHTLLEADTEKTQVTANQGVTAQELEQVLNSDEDDLGM